jgi:hypothetical protein
MESVIEAFIDAGRSLGLHAIEDVRDPVTIEATGTHVEEEENAA